MNSTSTDQSKARLLSVASAEAGVWLNVLRLKEEKVYFPDCYFHFSPVCVETLGAWGPGARELVRRIGSCVMDSWSRLETCKPPSFDPANIYRCATWQCSFSDGDHPTYQGRGRVHFVAAVSL